MKILDTKNAATFRPQTQTETRLEQNGLSRLQTASAKELLYIPTCKTMSNVHRQCTQTHICIDTFHTNSYVVGMRTLDQAAFALPPKDRPVLVSQYVRLRIAFRTVSESSGSVQATEGRAALKTFKQKTAVSSASIEGQRDWCTKVRKLVSLTLLASFDEQN